MIKNISLTSSFIRIQQFSFSTPNNQHQDKEKQEANSLNNSDNLINQYFKKSKKNSPSDFEYKFPTFKAIFKSKFGKKEEKQMILAQMEKDNIELKQQMQDRYRNYQLIQVSEFKKETSQKKLRDSILFEEILKNETEIVLYNCQGFHLLFRYFRIILALLVGLYYYQLVQQRPKKDKKNKIYYAGLFGFLFAIFIDHRRFMKRYVNKVIYFTKDQQLQLQLFNSFGRKYYIKLSKNQLVYTEDQRLNYLRINYIDMDSLEGYSIGYNYGWVNKKLFSHLIAQRIK